MSNLAKITKEMSNPRTIDLSEYDVEGVDQVQYQLPTPSELATLYSSPRYRDCTSDDQRGMIYGILVAHRALQKSDQSVTFDEVANLPVNVFTHIMQEITSDLNVDGDYLKNLPQ